jgi:hypothetical protein
MCLATASISKHALHQLPLEHFGARILQNRLRFGTSHCVLHVKTKQTLFMKLHEMGLTTHFQRSLSLMIDVIRVLFLSFVVLIPCLNLYSK